MQKRVKAQSQKNDIVWPWHHAKWLNLLCRWYTKIFIVTRSFSRLMNKKVYQMSSQIRLIYQKTFNVIHRRDNHVRIKINYCIKFKQRLVSNFHHEIRYIIFFTRKLCSTLCSLVNQVNSWVSSRVFEFPTVYQSKLYIPVVLTVQSDRTYLPFFFLSNSVTVYCCTECWYVRRLKDLPGLECSHYQPRVIHKSFGGLISSTLR